MRRENEVSGAIVDSAMRVHSRLGPGLFETVYEAALAHELSRRGYRVERQVPIHAFYDDADLGLAFRADLIVENIVIAELKSLDALDPIHKTQTLTYLRLTGLRLGLLLNFGAPRLREGIHRIANRL